VFPNLHQVRIEWTFRSFQCERGAQQYTNEWGLVTAPGEYTNFITESSESFRIGNESLVRGSHSPVVHETGSTMKNRQSAQTGGFVI
jgi:hypothetical protein